MYKLCDAGIILYYSHHSSYLNYIGNLILNGATLLIHRADFSRKLMLEKVMTLLRQVMMGFHRWSEATVVRLPFLSANRAVATMGQVAGVSVDATGCNRDSTASIRISIRLARWWPFFLLARLIYDSRNAWKMGRFWEILGIKPWGSRNTGSVNRDTWLLICYEAFHSHLGVPPFRCAIVNSA